MCLDVQLAQTLEQFNCEWSTRRASYGDYDAFAPRARYVQRLVVFELE
jgi:hypothetical protein